MTWWQIENPTPDRVIDALGRRFSARAQTLFAAEPRIQTILMTVAQYWADSALDEVHADLYFSVSAAIPWPHDCDRDDQSDPHFCQYCLTRPGTRLDESDFWLPTRTDAVTRAIEAYCLEGCTQYMPEIDVNLPFMFARRGVDGVEFVGQLQRPWMRPDMIEIDVPPPDLAPLFAEVYRRPDDDGPRHVLADCLQAAGDPRGTFIALQLQPNPTPEMRAEIDRLLTIHRNQWLGDLLQVASPARCRFSRGFASAIALGPAPAEAFVAVASSLAWATVSTLAFPELDEPPDWPILELFRYVQRIEAPEDVLEEMAETGGEWALTALHCTGTGTMDAIRGLRMPRLRRLLVEHPRPGDFGMLFGRSWWDQLTHLDVVAADPTPWFVAAVVSTDKAVRAVKPYAQVLIERVGSKAARVRAAANLSTSVAGLPGQLSAALPAGWHVDSGPLLTPGEHLALQRSLWTIQPD